MEVGSALSGVDLLNKTPQKDDYSSDPFSLRCAVQRFRFCSAIVQHRNFSADRDTRADVHCSPVPSLSSLHCPIFDLRRAKSTCIPTRSSNANTL